MARAIWSGAISFGLVNVPVKLYSAISQNNIQFHMLSPDGNCRLRQKLFCPETGEEYNFGETARGYEIAPNQYVILKKDEFDSLKPESGDVIEIDDFVDLKDIDPIYYDRPYYIGPDRGGDKVYRLFLEALEKTKRVGIGHFVMRSHEYLAAIRVKDNILCLETMNYAEDVRPANEVTVAEGKPDKRELSLATELIDSWTSQFDPQKYHSTYRERMRKVIEEKAEGRAVIAPAPKAKPGKVVNLMDALKASIEQKSSEKPAPRRASHGRKRSAG